MALEPIPTSEYILQPGNLFLSCGKTMIYRCASHPLCRIYWQEKSDPDLANTMIDRLKWSEGDKPKSPTAWKTESAWYDTGDPKKGWRRDGANFPSYLVELFDTDTHRYYEPQFLTLRWVPIVGTLDYLLSIVIAQKYVCLNTPVRPQTNLNLSPEQISRMLTIV